MIDDEAQASLRSSAAEALLEYGKTCCKMDADALEVTSQKLHTVLTSIFTSGRSSVHMASTRSPK